MYEQTQHLDKRDKYVLPDNKHHVLQQRNKSLQQFIERTRPKLQRAIRRTKTRLKLRNHSILEYIQITVTKKQKMKRPKITLPHTITTAITKYFSAKPQPHDKHNLKPP